MMDKINVRDAAGLITHKEQPQIRVHLKELPFDSCFCGVYIMQQYVKCTI